MRGMVLIVTIASSAVSAAAPERRIGLWAGTIAAGTIVATYISPAPVSSASPDEWAINGVFRVVSNGEWAQTNERFEDRPSVASVWTISTTCTAPTRCSGEMSSDQGWTAAIDQHIAGEWSVVRTLPGWLPCPDGTAADGEQRFRFYASDQNGVPDRLSRDFYAGEDRTTGPSGGCGVNKPVVIRMPFNLKRTVAGE